MRPPLRRVGRVAAVAFCAGLSAAAMAPGAVAHDMGVTRAAVCFTSDGRYTIDIAVDPQALLAQLAVEAGGGEPGPQGAGALAGSLGARTSQVATRVAVVFDGRPVSPAIEYVPESTPEGRRAPGAGPGSLGTLRLSGQVPRGARTFAFGYGWTLGAVALVVRGPAEEGEPIWLAPGQRSADLDMAGLRAGAWHEIATQYVALGFTHILPKGLDHILFVLGLFFLSVGWRGLLAQVTAFTVAHTLTLGLTMVGAIGLPASIVEPLIALSIVYVAVENLFVTGLRRSRVVVVFGFGLLHGMGFAGVLSELGVPAASLFTALVSFNAGVEAGQLAVIALATFALAGWRDREASLLPIVARPACVAIALVGFYWMVQRSLLG